MRAAVVESRPLVGLGIQRVLERIADIDGSSVVSPAQPPAHTPGRTLGRFELLVVGELAGGQGAGMLYLLSTASAVRCVLYLGSGGDVQWMLPRRSAPLLSWLPERATPDAIEHTVRTMIAALQQGYRTSDASAIEIDADGVPMLPAGGGTVSAAAPPRATLPTYAAEAQLLRLTQRQYDVLVLLSQGLSIKLVSHHLRISMPTVKSHALQVYRRLGVRNKAEAVFVAREHGALLAAPSPETVAAIAAVSGQ